MGALKVTESEIVDVLLGNADPALEARVRQAVRVDLRVAADYARWAQAIPSLRREVAPLKDLNRRVREGVMERLHEARSSDSVATGTSESENERKSLLAPATPRRKTPRFIPSIAAFLGAGDDLADAPPGWRDGWPDGGMRGRLANGFVAWVRGWLSLVRRVRQPRWAMAATAVLSLIAAVSLWVARSTGVVSVEQATGRITAFNLAPANGSHAAYFDNNELLRDISDSGNLPELAPGERLRLPVGLRVEEGARTVLRLPGGSVLTITDPVDLTIENSRRVRQASGTTTYRVTRRFLRDNFTVLIPQGTIEDLGTEFKVSVGEGDKAVVDVQEGRVRVLPMKGRAVDATAGEQAVISSNRAAVAPQPAWIDLALERARHKTHLLTRGPAPQSYQSETPPAGVKEIHYASSSLSLMAWVSDDPGDGKKHPAVVYAHGGFSFAQADWDVVAPYLRAGYVVMAPTYRGENGNPGDFECFYGEVDDLIAAGKHLAGLAYVDPKKIFLSGHSIGADLATLAAMLPSPFIEVAAIGASTDPVRRYFGAKVPFDAADPHEGLLRTPRAFAESIRRPLHLIMGENDFTLQEWARSMARDAEKKGKPCKIWITSGDHHTSLTPAVERSIEIFNARMSAGTTGIAGAENAEAGPRTVEYQPALLALSAESPLAALVQPQSVALGMGVSPTLVRRTPPFTSARPLFGTLRLTDERGAIEAAVACDEKLDVRRRIYFDANCNRDLTDDPSFSEGEDFVAGQYFEVGFQERGNALWLRLPVGSGQSAKATKTGETANGAMNGGLAERLEFVNRLYYTSPVDLRDDKGRDADVVGKRPVSRYSLLDVDSDGDHFDPEGAYGVWSIGDGSAAAERIVSLAPVGKPMVHSGYQLTLMLKPDGGFELSGRKLSAMRKNVLRAGEPMPPIEVETTDGHKLRLASPKDGWLLVYVWSTWFSACQRDVPFAFNDLYPKFKDRGLSMVGISVNYRREELINYVSANGVAYPQVYNGPDLLSGVTGQLGVGEVPFTILVDPQGRIVSLGKSGEEIWSTLDANLPKAKVAAGGGR